MSLDQITDWDAITRAAEEIRLQREYRDHKQRQESLKVFECPDCMAILKIETSHDLPEDIKIVFIKHQC
jgi:hypothetical protein